MMDAEFWQKVADNKPVTIKAEDLNVIRRKFTDDPSSVTPLELKVLNGYFNAYYGKPVARQ